MRLTEEEKSSIRGIVYGMDPEAKIYLFGSRADDTKRGGDIDLLVMSQLLTDKNRREIKLKLYDAIGEQKIDLIIAADDSEPFVRIALESGVTL